MCMFATTVTYVSLSDITSQTYHSVEISWDKVSKSVQKLQMDIDNLMEKIARIISKYSKAIGYNIQKSIEFPYSSNEISECEINDVTSASLMLPQH